MNIDCDNSFSSLASKKRKRWQCVADDLARNKKNCDENPIGRFITSVWKLAVSQTRQGARKAIRFHDDWHTLNDADEIPKDCDMIDY